MAHGGEMELHLAKRVTPEYGQGTLPELVVSMDSELTSCLARESIYLHIHDFFHQLASMFLNFFH